MRMAGEVIVDPMIFPNQRTQHERGEADLVWQYPFRRSELVKAGLLPAGSVSMAGAQSIELPRGVSVFEAIQAGIIR